MKVKEQVKQLLAALNEGLYEKEETMALALLSAIAGESIFLLGAPGVAKSLIARRLKFAFKDGKAFEYLMNRFSTPDEIFGPVSIKALKEDRYERITEDYLPGATVVFLDEIWKAGPSIQNALLTVLNEKVYRNGAQEVKVPMKALISASNELPAKGEGLEALWDRFIVRLLVGGIAETEAFNKMITTNSNAYEDNVPENIKITDEQYNEWGKAIDKIVIPDNVLNVIQVIRASLQENNSNQNGESIYVSDRRWRKIIRLMRTSAFLNDRKEVDLMDCFLILHCIWDVLEQMNIISSQVKKAIERNGFKIMVDLETLRSTISDFNDEVENETRFKKKVKLESPKVHHGQYYFIQGRDYPLIQISDFELLTASPKRTSLYRDSKDDWERRNYSESAIISKAASGTSLIINSNSYKLKVDVSEEATVTTKAPNQRLKAAWDNHVEQILDQTNLLKEQIQEFRTKDLAVLRNNLFVNSLNAGHVETNLIDSLHAIEKLEVEVKKIKHHYETVKTETQTKTTKK